ncbi:YqhA family protein [Methanosarcina sp. 2.H.A.1B.4]|uniref:YqhA family protein n=1 Tax=Methanosarcina sp. 2.H.A.1B.4 TaxID=1483600 RepID=UPI000620EAE2|nr:YqhA family protein [Methanosarcina sp. 2.H.A.1B.4]KKG09077.1 hypothetical protein EO92_17665 [Methanosarcina sp. 2.H.A.1B.4]
MKVVRFIAGIRYFVLIPVIGLAIAACALFIKGGVDLVRFMGELITGMAEAGPEASIIVEIVETVHLFLVGTVLFLTSIGLYQLFIQPLPLPGWLEINDIEELELNLVGLTIVVLGVNFLSIIFEPQETNLAVYGIGYALPIAALAYFMKVRSNMSKGSGKGERLTSLVEAASEGGDSSWLTNKKRD